MDIISELPDSLLTQILSYLAIQDSIKTSVLSKRWEFLWIEVYEFDVNAINSIKKSLLPKKWEYLWRKVSGLDLNAKDLVKTSVLSRNWENISGLDLIDFLPLGEHLLRLVERHLELNRGLCLKNFKITLKIWRGMFPFDCSKSVMELIAEVIHRGVEHLEVEKKMSEIKSNVDFMPKLKYVSKTLVSLKLVNVGLEDTKLNVSLPRLKTMHLEKIYRKRYSLYIVQSLLKASTVLEDLTMDVPVQEIPKNFVFRKAPKCLYSTLKYVMIKLIMNEEIGIKLANYFLENSKVLKKLTLSLTHPSFINQESYKKLLTPTKVSPRCQILVY